MRSEDDDEDDDEDDEDDTDAQSKCHSDVPPSSPRLRAVDEDVQGLALVIAGDCDRLAIQWGQAGPQPRPDNANRSAQNAGVRQVARSGAHSATATPIKDEAQTAS